MVQPVFFDGDTNEFKQASAADPVDDATLPLTAVRTDGSTPFVGVQAGVDPVADDDLTTKVAVRRFIAEVGSWWGQVISAAVANPAALTPTTDQRWLIAPGASGAWNGHSNHLATWRNAAWVFTVPVKGTTVYDQNVGVHLTYSGTAWARSVLHAALSDLQGGTSGQYYHLTAAQHTAFTGSQAAKLIWATPTGASGVPSMRALVIGDLPNAGGAGQVVLSGGGGVPAWGTLAAADVGAVPTSRGITAGSGLSGGGSLASDLTLSWDGGGWANNGADVGAFVTIDVIGEASITDNMDGSANLQLPDATLYAMIFGD